MLQREHTDDNVTLVVINGGDVSRIPFKDPSALVAFQNDMEEMLVHTGWVLVQFDPERRIRDRRTFPRVENDRRRWWTDPVENRPADTPTRKKRRNAS